MTDLISDYDSLTVEEVSDWLDDHQDDLSVDDLRSLKEYETANKDRVTVLRDIDDLLDEKSTTEDRSEDSELTIADESLTGSVSPVTDDSSVESSESTDSTLSIRPETNLVAGEWYDNPGTMVVTVPDSVRVRRAIKDGRATLISDEIDIG